MTSNSKFRDGAAAIRSEFASVAAIPDLARYWLGQLVSEIGSGATSFVLMTYVYIETKSLVLFALLFALDNIPDIILSPWAGNLTDKYDRRLLHIIGDGGVALVTIGAIALWLTDGLTVGTVYALVLAASCFAVIQGAAAEAVYQELVPPDKLVRAGALMGPVDELVEIVAPAVGVAILASVGVGAVFVVDLITFTVALWTLFTLKNPQAFRQHMTEGYVSPDADAEDDEEDVSSFQFFMEGARFLKRNAGMSFIWRYSVFDSFFISLVLLLVAAVSLEMGGEETLALVQGAAGVGAIAGMVLVAIFGLRRGNVITANVPGPGIMIGLVLLLAALVGTPAALAAAAAVVMILSAPLDSAIEATSLAATPKPLIGRVSAFVDTIDGLANLVILLLIAPLIDWVLAPALERRTLSFGPFNNIAGGTGPAVPLLLVIGLAGLGLIALNVWALLTPKRHAADELARPVETGPAFVPRPEERTHS